MIQVGTKLSSFIFSKIKSVLFFINQVESHSFSYKIKWVFTKKYFKGVLKFLKFQNLFS